jgi:hypothetical protein
MGRDRPLSALVPVALAVLALATLLVVIPWLLERRFEPPPVATAPPPPPTTHSPEEIRAFVDRELEGRTVLSRAQGSQNEPVVTVEVPPDANAMTEAETLKKAADSAGLEAYAVDVDGLDAEARFYQQAVVARVRFVPTVPRTIDVPPAMRPALVAVIVTGIGETPTLPKAIEKAPIPLTVAIDAFRPGTLEAAEAAAHASCEILVALAPDSPAASQGKAVPYASGFLLSEDAAVPPLVDSFQVVIAPHPLAPGPRTVVAQWASPERDTRLALRRALWLASRTGSAALVVRADDPLLPEVLALLADTPNVRPVLASEAARPAEVKGPTHEDAEREQAAVMAQQGG